MSVRFTVLTSLALYDQLTRESLKAIRLLLTAAAWVKIGLRRAAMKYMAVLQHCVTGDTSREVSPIVEH